jgi:hypothetical protein
MGAGLGQPPSMIGCRSFLIVGVDTDFEGLS